MINRIFKFICSDEAPITRRAAASKLKDIVLVVEPIHVENEILPAFLSLLNDDQDSVRVAVVESFPAILKSIQNNEKLLHILLTELCKLFKDKSWRIRFKIAESISQFQDIVSDDFSEQYLIPTYTSLLKDDEPEVRTVAANRLYDFSQKLPEITRSDVIISKFVPCVKILVDDMNMNVKSAIASVLLKLGDFLSKNE